MQPQFITDSQGKRTGVILSMEEYNRLMELIEDAEDVALYKAAKEEGGDTIPLEEYLESRKKKS